MIIQTGKVAGGVADAVTKSGPLKILDNPLVTALIITVIAMMIFFSLLGKDGRLKEVGWKTRLRVGVYIFIAVGLVTAVHYYALNRELSEFYKGGASDQLMDDIHGGNDLSQLDAFQPAFVQPQPISGGMALAPQGNVPMARVPMAAMGMPPAAMPQVATPAALANAAAPFQLAPVPTDLLPSAA